MTSSRDKIKFSRLRSWILRFSTKFFHAWNYAPRFPAHAEENSASPVGDVWLSVYFGSSFHTGHRLRFLFPLASSTRDFTRVYKSRAPSRVTARRPRLHVPAKKKRKEIEEVSAKFRSLATRVEGIQTTRSRSGNRDPPSRPLGTHLAEPDEESIRGEKFR